AMTHLTRFNHPDTGLNVPHGNAIEQSRIADSDTRMAWSAGALYRPNEWLSAGVVYVNGPAFRILEDYQYNNSSTTLDWHSYNGYPKPISINVPNRLGLGVAVRPNSRLLIPIDVVHIAYSEIARHITPILSDRVATSANYSISDVTEVHVGGEWT